MNIFHISILLFGFSSIWLGMIVCFKRRDKVGGRWLVFSIACGLWGVGYAFQINNNVPYEQALWISRAADAIAIFIPVTWLHFVYEFLGFRKKERSLLFLYLLSGAIFLTFPTNLFVAAMKDKSHIGIDHFVAPGPSFHLLTVLFATLVATGLFLIFRAYLKEELDLERKTQIKYLFLASTFGFIGGATAFLPVYDIDVPVLYGTLLMPIFPFLMFFAITKFRLLDVEEIADAFQKEKLAALGVMASSLNHELRNPLFIAKGRIESFKDGVERGVYPSKDQEEQKSKEVMDVAHEQLTRAMDIMQRFSDFAKPMNVKQKKEKVLLKETAEDVLKLVSNEFELKKIKLNKISMNGECIQANYRQIEEIFFNLVINACHAMDQPSVSSPNVSVGDPSRSNELTISATQSKDKVTIEIADTGPGINKENQRRIFEPFYSTKGKKGSGLGLYITKQLVERNGGKISVKSKVGEGTKFLLEFKV